MGIFNEQSYNHPFARGIQGSPDPSDAVTRKQLDNAGVGDITADINLKNSYNIQNNKKRTFNQL